MTIAPAGGPGRVPGAPGPRVLLLVPARSYRAADFLLAATRMGLDLVIGSDGALPLGGRPVIPVNPADPDASTRRVLARAGAVAERQRAVAAYDQVQAHPGGGQEEVGRAVGASGNQ